jgi:patatin-related protein
MREKELRLALICYGGVSLAVYMHGVTKEVWRLAAASRSFHSGEAPQSAHAASWHALLNRIAADQSIRLRILPDIIAGASAGGINGVFLAQAIATGQSLEPLTDLWLDNADVDRLLDPDARPFSRFTKFWAMPFVWYMARRKGGAIRRTVSKDARAEVTGKLSRLIRARWLAPPFGGAGFSSMLLDAFDAMAALPKGPRLLPAGQPLDLFVTVTDFTGHPSQLKLNSPPVVEETEHRITISFVQKADSKLADSAELVFAARATASFPGAFPPFNVAELDGVLTARGRAWDGRIDFLSRILPGRETNATQTVLIDGSVLANAPFRPAIEALRNRPARREVDRRFVYIDPKPGMKSVRITRSGDMVLPGFFSTIFGAMSDIPREQPIRDSLESLEGRSARIRRMQHIVEALRPDVDAAIEALFGLTFFLDRPTPDRLRTWRQKAQDRAARDAGYGYAGYAHAKLSAVVEDLAQLAQRLNPELRGAAYDGFRQDLWTEVRMQDVDKVSAGVGKGARPATIAFFRGLDLGFRIRRMRFVVRTLSRIVNETGDDHALEPARIILFRLLARYLDLEATGFYRDVSTDDAAAYLAQIASIRRLTDIDAEADSALAEAFALCPKEHRRTLMFAYLGFPFFDLATLPMLQGEGLDEFDPIKVDRISPDDVTTVMGGVKETLKGIEFNSFGAFFSRAYRENDYLWGRLHGADRLVDIVLSSAGIAPGHLDSLKRDVLLAILDEESARLPLTAALIAEVRAQIAGAATHA